MDVSEDHRVRGYFLNELSDCNHVLRYYVSSILLTSSLHLNIAFHFQDMK